jgi:hypothetical protein
LTVGGRGKKWTLPNKLLCIILECSAKVMLSTNHYSSQWLPRVPVALGEDLTPSADGRRRFFFFFSFPSVFLSRVQHSGKKFVFFKKKPSSPSAAVQALGEANFFIYFFKI